MVVCLYRLKMVVFPVEKNFIHALAIEHRLINREGLTGSSLYYQLTYSIFISVQAEKKKIATTTFLDAWDLRSHMAGHFHLWHAVFSYHPGLLGPSS